MSADSKDWRRTGQERYLTGASFERRAYEAPSQAWDHEHCEFCWAKFMPTGKSADASVLSEGYVTADDRWVCDGCFADFRDEFNWIVAPPSSSSTA